MVKDLDIFDRVGHSTAHDEIIPMSIKKGKLSVQGEVSTFTGKLHIEFVKVIRLRWSEPRDSFSPSSPAMRCGCVLGEERWWEVGRSFLLSLFRVLTDFLFLLSLGLL